MFTLPLLVFRTDSCCWHRGSTPGRPSVARNNLQRLVTFTLANFQSLPIYSTFLPSFTGHCWFQQLIYFHHLRELVYIRNYVQHTERFRAHALGWHWPAPSESKLCAQQPASTSSSAATTTVIIHSSRQPAQTKPNPVKWRKKSSSLLVLAAAWCSAMYEQN